jgi:hypothetical protein
LLFGLPQGLEEHSFTPGAAPEDAVAEDARR